MMNLVKRKMVAKPYCPICVRDEESIGHALWSCVSATDVWAENDSAVQKWVSSEGNLLEGRTKWLGVNRVGGHSNEATLVKKK